MRERLNLSALPNKERRKFAASLGIITLGLLVFQERVFAEAEQTPPLWYTLPEDKYGVRDVAITVDDCWWPEHLEKILDVVEEERIPLTIFPAGRVLRSVSIRNQLLRACQLGCFVGNHTYSHEHIKWPGMSDEDV